MDDQALLEGIVVFSDEDGPEIKNKKRVGVCDCVLKHVVKSESFQLLDISRFCFQPF